MHNNTHNPIIKEAISPKCPNENLHLQTKVRLHICSMSMANIITSLTNKEENNTTNPSNNYIKAKSRKKKKKNQQITKQTDIIKKPNKPLDCSFSIEKNHYSIKSYFTSNKVPKETPRKERFILIKKSSDKTKSPLVIGLVLKQKAKGNEQEIYFHNFKYNSYNSSNSESDSGNNYMIKLYQRIKSAIEQNRISYKETSLFNGDTSLASSFCFKNEYSYSFYPFSVPLELNHLLKKKKEKEPNDENEVINNNQREDEGEDNQGKQYPQSQFAIHNFRLFIPASVKKVSYTIKRINSSSNNSNSPTKKLNIYYLKKKRNRDDAQSLLNKIPTQSKNNSIPYLFPR